MEAFKFGGGGFGFQHSKRANQGITETKRIETASIIVAEDETGDFQGIQEAINSLNGSGGYIQIKEGIYSISKTIKVPSNVTIQGSGHNTLINFTLSTNFKNLFENEDQSGGNSNIVIKNFRLESSGGGAHQGGIYIENCNNCTIEEIKGGNGFHYMINIDDSNNTFVKNCHDFAGSVTGYGLYCSSENCVIIGNNFRYRGIVISGDNNIVSNNNINDSIQEAAITLNGNGCTVIGNQIYNSNYDGIWADSGDYNIIVGNNCKNASNYGISFGDYATYNLASSNIATITDDGSNNTKVNNINA